MDLSIIVPTRNRAHLLDDCLRSFGGQSYDDDYEVVVVDNGSTDRTRATVTQAMRTMSNLRLVAEPTAGLNRARNAGVTAATGDAIAFIDDDELVPTDYVARVLAALRDHSEAAGVGGPYRDCGGSGARVCERCGGLGAVDVPASDDGRSDRLLGGNMVIRRSAFDAVGQFDQTLSGRGDETEWFERATRAGLSFHYGPELWVEHRRDVFSARELLWTQFRQGLSRPLAASRMNRRFKPRPALAVRGIGHALRHRCLRGGVTAARELGAIAGFVRHPSVLRAGRNDRT